jgi:glycosyltransferase involved in cell wall biosynthesis
LKILFIHSGVDLYGASRSLLRLSTRLVKDGHEVYAVLPSNGQLCPELQKEGVHVIIQKGLMTIVREEHKRTIQFIRLIFRYIATIIQLLVIIKPLNPDIIHTMTAVIPSPAIAAKILRKTHIWHIRESFSEFPTLWKFYQQYIYTFSDRIISVSTPVSEQFTPRHRKKITVLYNGFPEEEFLPVDESRIAHFREQFGLKENNIVVGVVGRIKFLRKGQEVFVEAAGLLREKYPNARFLCIGSPFPGNEEHLNRLMGLIHQLNLETCVIYTGDVDDIKAAIAALDILVLPSVQPEPFGGVVIEAMALKKPVVATAIGGSIEQVVNNETGFLVKPGDVFDLANSLDVLLANESLRKQYGKVGYKRFISCFEFEDFYRKILSLYSSYTRVMA